jgi:Leucine-rich repeat (LRR) protein
VSGLPNLQVLGCGDNSLTSIDVSHNPKLYRLHLHNNRLQSVNLSNNPGLCFLGIQGNRLTSLDISPCDVLVDLVQNGTRQEYNTDDGLTIVRFTNGEEIPGDGGTICSLYVDKGINLIYPHIA